MLHRQRVLGALLAAGQRLLSGPFLGLLQEELQEGRRQEAQGAVGRSRLYLSAVHFENLPSPEFVWHAIQFTLAWMFW